MQPPEVFAFKLPFDVYFACAALTFLVTTIQSYRRAESPLLGYGVTLFVLFVRRVKPVFLLIAAGFFGLLTILHHAINNALTASSGQPTGAPAPAPGAPNPEKKNQ
ncbi:hypothetical protein PAPYR_5390 [Paratrimastix pyriformis]|uniref:PRA1 family protein n=1 Tax=Paratrimastix pyriformis TaxID=342808 RepID=A0ABQ8UI05_9EUKA|nr:hypothetical protein PAPYR_5390 [Paratrimastix pyriformis]